MQIWNEKPRYDCLAIAGNFHEDQRLPERSSARFLQDYLPRTHAATRKLQQCTVSKDMQLRFLPLIFNTMTGATDSQPHLEIAEHMLQADCQANGPQKLCLSMETKRRCHGEEANPRFVPMKTKEAYGSGKVISLEKSTVGLDFGTPLVKVSMTTVRRMTPFLRNQEAHSYQMRR